MKGSQECPPGVRIQHAYSIRSLLTENFDPQEVAIRNVQEGLQLALHLPRPVRYLPPGRFRDPGLFGQIPDVTFRPAHDAECVHDMLRRGAPGAQQLIEGVGIHAGDLFGPQCLPQDFTGVPQTPEGFPIEQRPLPQGAEGLVHGQ